MTEAHPTITIYELPYWVEDQNWVKKPGVDLGILPQFISNSDPRSAIEQIHENYAHGGGWYDFKGFSLDFTKPLHELTLEYPEDPPMEILAFTTLRNEIVALFPRSWVAVIQRDGSFKIVRIN